MEDTNTENKSSFELQQTKMMKIIGNLEEGNITKEKSWNLLGEVTSKQRPLNSLLDNYLDYDSTANFKPKITQDFTNDIESIITRRIKDKCYDDVLKKNNSFREDYKKSNANLLLALESKHNLDNKLSQSNKVSLSAIYEQEFLKNKEKNGVPTMLRDSKQPTLRQIHDNIHNDMKILFESLDALCNLRYKPLTAEHEIKISGPRSENDSLIIREEMTPLINAEPRIILKNESKHSSTAQITRAIKNTLPKLEVDPTKSSVNNKRGKRKTKTGDKKKFDFVKEWQARNETQKVGGVKKLKKLGKIPTSEINSTRIKL